MNLDPASKKNTFIGFQRRIDQPDIVEQTDKMVREFPGDPMECFPRFVTFQALGKAKRKMRPHLTKQEFADMLMGPDDLPPEKLIPDAAGSFTKTETRERKVTSSDYEADRAASDSNYEEACREVDDHNQAIRRRKADDAQWLSNAREGIREQNEKRRRAHQDHVRSCREHGWNAPGPVELASAPTSNFQAEATITYETWVSDYGKSRNYNGLIQRPKRAGVRKSDYAVTEYEDRTVRDSDAYSEAVREARVINQRADGEYRQYMAGRKRERLELITEGHQQYREDIGDEVDPELKKRPGAKWVMDRMSHAYYVDHYAPFTETEFRLFLEDWCSTDPYLKPLIQKRPFVVPVKYFWKHTAVFGSSGSGKSSLLNQLMIQTALKHAGLCSMILIDPKGDLARQFARNRYVQERCAEHIFYFDPKLSQTAFPRMNLLEIPRTADGREINQSTLDIYVEGVVDTLTELFGEEGAMTFGQGNLLKWALELMMVIPGSTLLDLVRLISGDHDRYLTHLHKVNNPFSRMYGDRDKGSFFSPNLNPTKTGICNRMQSACGNNALRNIVGVSTSTFQLHDLIRQRKIAIFNLSPSGVGTAGCLLIGRMLLAQIKLLGALEHDSAQPSPCHIFVDEAPKFVRGSGASEEILAEMRSSRKWLTLAAQHPEQLPKRFLADILSNTGITFCGKNSNRAYATLLDDLEVQRGDLKQLGTGNFAVKVKQAEANQPALAPRIFQCSDRFIDRREWVDEDTWQRFLSSQMSRFYTSDQEGLITATDTPTELNLPPKTA